MLRCLAEFCSSTRECCCPGYAVHADDIDRSGKVIIRQVCTCCTVVTVMAGVAEESPARLLGAEGGASSPAAGDGVSLR